MHLITSFLKKIKFIQDTNPNQLKLEIHDTYKKIKKLTRDFEPTDDSDVINKAYPDEKLLGINGHLSFLGKRL